MLTARQLPRLALAKLFIVKTCAYYSPEEAVSVTKTGRKLKGIFFVA